MARARLDPKARELLALSQLSALAFGAGLLVWGLAPLLIVRVVTHAPPPTEEYAVRSLTLLVGMLFIGLVVLVHKQIRWALLAMAALSFLLVLSGVAWALFGQRSTLAIFPLLLATATTVTSMSAMAAIYHAEQRARSVARRR
jgi:hypothetical protein